MRSAARRYKDMRDRREPVRKAGDAITSMGSKIGSNEYVKSATDKLGEVDDFIQGGMRNLILGSAERAEPTGGGDFIQQMREYAALPFAARAGSPQKTYDKFTGDNAMAAMIASRGLQAGAVTAAGTGLYSLAVNLGQGEQSPGTIMP